MLLFLEIFNAFSNFHIYIYKDHAGGPGPSSSDASTSPTGSKNGVSAIKASAMINFIFGISTLFVSSFF